MKLVLLSLLIALTQLNANADSLSISDSTPLSLKEAHEYAVKNSASMKNARIDASIAEKQIAETRAIGLPQINASAEYQYYFEIPTSLIPAEFFGGQPGEFAEIQFGTEQNLSANLNVNQLIFDGSYFIGLRAAKIYRDISNKNIEKSEIDIKVSVSQTYYLALITQENIKILQENLENMNKIYYETEKMFEAGFTDQINKEQLILAVSRLKNTLSNLKRQEKLTNNLLKFQIGMDMQTDLELTDDLTELIKQINLETVKSENFNHENHIDYKIVKSYEYMQEMNFKRERSAYWPKISGNYVYQQSAMRNEFNFLDSEESWFPTSFFGVSISIPIFSSGMKNSRVQQAKLELNKAKISTQQTSSSIQLQMEEARAEFNTAMEKYQNDKENLELANKILKRTNIMHKEGLASSLELTQANDQLLETQGSYLQAIFELLNAKNELDKALGRL
ncbi:MAG: TolC family protein [Bacteroidota bacterium]